MIGPWLIAWGSETLNLTYGFGITLVLTFLTLLFVFILYKRNVHE